VLVDEVFIEMWFDGEKAELSGFFRSLMRGNGEVRSRSDTISDVIAFTSRRRMFIENERCAQVE